MAKSKNETAILLVSLAITGAIVGGGLWWLRNNFFGGGQVASSTAQTAQIDGQDNSSNNRNSQSSNSPSSNSTANSTSGRNAGSSFSSVSNVPNGRFSYGGSTTWAPLRGTLDPAIERAIPGFDLMYRDASGSSDGIKKLVAGELAFAQSSRPLKREEKQQGGVLLKEIPVAMEAVAIATHPDLPIPGLTLTQLKDIYTSRVTNWNQVGGPNLAITPISRSDSGTTQFFQEAVLEDESFSASIKELANTTQALRFVSDNPGAIYYASAPEIVGQCTVAPLPIGDSPSTLVTPYQAPYVSPNNCPAQRNQLNLSAFQSQSYPLIRPLYIMVKEDGQLGQQAGEAYAELMQTGEAQNLLQQAGFVPLP